jgi:spore germination protein YaaH
MKSVVMFCVILIAAWSINCLGQGLIAEWPMNESSGNIVADISGNNHNGTAINGSIESGRVGNCRILSGQNSEIDFGSNPAYNLTTPFSFAMWVKVNNSDQIPFIFSNAGSYRGFWFRIEQYDGVNRFSFMLQGTLPSGGSLNDGPLSNTPVQSGTWYHIACVALSNTQLQLYVNGNLDASKTISSGYIPEVIRNLKIGVDANQNWMSPPRMNGLVDEVQLYNRALSADEIHGLYQEGSGGSNITIHGTIKGEFNIPINGVTVFLLMNNSIIGSVETGSDGAYSFSVPEETGYKISASKIGRVTKNAFAQSCGDPVDIELDLAKQSNRSVGAWTSGTALSQNPCRETDNGYDNFLELQRSIGGTSPYCDVYREISPFEWLMDNQGHISVVDPNSSIITFARGNNILTIPSNGNVTYPIIQNMLDSDIYIDNAVAGLCSLAVISGWDGIDMDFESFGDNNTNFYRTQYNHLIENLYYRLNSINKYLTVTVQPRISDAGNVFDYETLADNCDELRIMLYDMGGIWNAGDTDPDNPRPHSPIDNQSGLTIKDVLDYAIQNCGVSNDKLIMGLPTYGNIWIGHSVDGQFDAPRNGDNQIINHQIVYGDIDVNWEENIPRDFNKGWIPHLIYPELAWACYPEGWNFPQGNTYWNNWYEDNVSLAIKLDYALSRGVRGVCLFGLGSMDPQNYSRMASYSQGIYSHSDKMCMIALCPIDLEIWTTDGLYINSNGSTIPNSRYDEVQLERDNNLDVLVNFFDSLNTRFTIHAVPKPGVAETDSFTILAVRGAQVDTIVSNQLIRDIPTEGYLYSTMLVGSIAGVINYNGSGLDGTPVDLFNDSGDVISSTASNASGYYHFDNVVNGLYTVSITTPLGYAADEESIDITIAGLDETVNFNLSRTEMAGRQRNACFWGHQVQVFLSGRGRAEVPLSTFCNYLDNIRIHFNDNRINPILIYQVSQPANERDSLQAVSNLLSLHCRPPMNARARKQLMSLLLNVASLKISQTTVISRDGRTVSQAITYCNALIADNNNRNDEIARDIAMKINNGRIIPAGIIPRNTPNIAYKPEIGGIEGLPVSFELSQNYPNPFNAQSMIEYSLPMPCHVTVEIYDMLGRKISILVDENQQAGSHQLTWNASNVASGMYFYKIQAGEFTETKKMLLMK